MDGGAHHSTVWVLRRVAAVVSVLAVASLVLAGDPARLLAGEALALGDPVEARVVPVEPAVVVATSTTTTTEPPPPPLPQPESPPEDPRRFEGDVVVGTIEIPKLALVEPLRQGIALTTIDKGPSHWPGTALPGQLGNVVVAGHRVTHTRPFRHIDSLVPGDRVVFTTPDGRFEYQMVGNEVVTPHGMHIVDQHHAFTATLFACHPPGSARYRYVVHLELVGAPPL